MTAIPSKDAETIENIKLRLTDRLDPDTRKILTSWLIATYKTEIETIEKELEKELIPDTRIILEEWLIQIRQELEEITGS